MDPKPRHSDNIRRLSVYSARRGNPEKKDDQRQKKEDDSHVMVAVRCRPMSEKEDSAGYEPIVEFESESRIVVHDVSEQPSDQLGTKSGERHNISHVYDFDRVFDCQSKQEEVYEIAVKPLIDQVLLGFNATVFAYGQTGTGKTYTMEGPNHQYQSSISSRRESKQRKQSSASNQNIDNSRRSSRDSRGTSSIQNSDPIQIASKEQVGIIPRTFEQIFEHVAQNPDIQFLIRASYLEIYQEEIRDLLKKDAKAKLELHERSDIGVYVKDLTSFVCKSISEIERVMRVGNQNRIVAATDMNEHSSRSHAIFMITIEQQQQAQGKSETKLNTVDGKEATTDINKKNAVIRVGKLNLVDLAGSERQRKTNSFGQRQKESMKINLSLSALGNVINSLMRLERQRQDGGDNKHQSLIHTPYRDSKLTRLLQDSLGGNAKTLMIANIGPASYNYDETINTLNYASRARCIKNKPRLNEDPKDALLRELQQEIDLLRKRLALSAQTATDTAYSQRDNQSSGVSSAKSATSSRGGSGGQMTGDKKLVEKEFFELRQKLSSLESKLLNSDKSSAAVDLSSNLSPSKQQQLDHQSMLKGLTREQELELEKRQEELAKLASREQAIRDELERREEAELQAKQSFESIQQEVEAKRRLTWKVLLKVKTIRDDIDTMQQAYRVELDELDQLQGVLQRELKLKCLIMDNFIPNSHVDQLLSRVSYNERRNLCTIEPLELPGRDFIQSQVNNSNCFLTSDRSSFEVNREKFTDFWQPTLGGSIRPRSEMERISEVIYPNNIRYKYEDLISPNWEFSATKEINDTKLARPPRRLCDKLAHAGDHQTKIAALRSSPQDLTAAAKLQALINEALDRREPDIVI